jgi:hypothetical protein
MVAPATVQWSSREYCLTADALASDLSPLAGTTYDLVCRDGFSAPGFCLIDLGQNTTSQTMRRFMLSLRAAMGDIHSARTGKDLAYLSAARFDQQVTTKLHRDSGPAECF